MSSDNDSRDGGSRAGSNPSGKRPHATLDLKAVEIKDQPDPAKATPQSTSSTATVAAATAGKNDDAAKSDMDKKSSAGATAAKTGAGQNGDTSNGKADATKDKATPPKSSKRRGGFFGPLVGGLLGGLVAVFGGDYALQKLGIPKLAGSETQSMDALELRLSDLEQQADASGSNDAPGNGQQPIDATQIAETRTQLDALSQTVTELSQRQDALRQDVQTLNQQLTDGSSPGVSGGEQDSRLSQLEDQMKIIAAAAEANPNAGPVSQIAALSKKISDLEASLATESEGARTGTSLDGQSATKLQDAVRRAAAAKSDTERLDTTVAAVKSTTDRLDQRVAAIKTDADKLSESVKILNETTLKMSTELSTLRQNLQTELGSVARPSDINAAVTPYKDRIGHLESTLKTLQQHEAQRADQARNVVLSLELANLQRAVNSGKPFQDSLTKVKTATGGELDLSSLDPYAASGVATLDTLQEEFRPLIQSMLQASKPKADASFVDQLMSQAKSIVRIRKVDHDSSDNSVEAIVARMEDNLKAGNLTAVTAEGKTLPAENRAPAESWLAQIAARNTVNAAMTKLQTNLKTALTNAD